MLPFFNLKRLSIMLNKSKNFNWARDKYPHGILLGGLTIGKPVANLTNQFSNPTLLKSRIAMLYKPRNSQWVLGKYLAVVVLVGLIAGSMAFKPALLPQILDQATEKIKVKGVVVDTDNRPLPDFLVKVADAKMFFLTDKFGQYEATIPVSSDFVFGSKIHQAISVKVKGDQVVNAVLAKTGASDSSVVHVYPWIIEEKWNTDEINLGQLIPRYAPDKARPQPDTLYPKFRFLGDVNP